jgi:hypothetical protein
MTVLCEPAAADRNCRRLPFLTAFVSSFSVDPELFLFAAGPKHIGINAGCGQELPEERRSGSARDCHSDPDAADILPLIFLLHKHKE